MANHRTQWNLQLANERTGRQSSLKMHYARLEMRDVLLEMLCVPCASSNELAGDSRGFLFCTECLLNPQLIRYAFGDV